MLNKCVTLASPSEMHSLSRPMRRYMVGMVGLQRWPLLPKKIQWIKEVYLEPPGIVEMKLENPLEFGLRAFFALFQNLSPPSNLDSL